MNKRTVIDAPWCKMPMDLIRNTSFQRSHMVVYAECDWQAGKRGWFYKTQKELGDILSLSLSSVNHAVSDLKAAGFLVVEDLGTKYGHVCRYIIPARTQSVPDVDHVELRNELDSALQPVAFDYATGNVHTTDVLQTGTKGVRSGASAPGAAKPRGVQSRKLKAPSDSPGKTLSPLAQAFKERNLAFTVKEGREVKYAGMCLREFGPAAVAGCWQAIMDGTWGSKWDRENIGFYMLYQNKKVRNWMDQRGNDGRGRVAGSGPDLSYLDSMEARTNAKYFPSQVGQDAVTPSNGHTQT